MRIEREGKYLYLTEGQLISKCLFLQKNEQKNRLFILWYLKSYCFRSFFERIEDNKKTFQNQLTFSI